MNWPEYGSQPSKTRAIEQRLKERDKQVAEKARRSVKPAVVDLEELRRISGKYRATEDLHGHRPRGVTGTEDQDCLSRSAVGPGVGQRLVGRKRREVLGSAGPFRT